MRVQLEDAALLAALTEWLSKRGWSVVEAGETGETGVEVLIPWDQDEFAAALRLRGELAAWRTAHGAGPVSVDGNVWMSAPHAA
jgi:hypothetical protein